MKTSNKHHDTKKGKLIVSDGIDGSGKATQTALLTSRLKKEGVSVKTIDFPQYTKNFFGKLLRECLDGKHGDFLHLDPRIVSLLYAADRFESSARIRSWLSEGYIVIADRYTSANQIHQGSKLADVKEQKNFLQWLDRMEHDVLGVPRPDLVLFLHVPVRISQELIKGRVRDLAESDTAHQEKALLNALAVIKKGKRWKKVPCTKDGGILPKEVIHEKVYAIMKKELVTRP